MLCEFGVSNLLACYVSFISKNVHIDVDTYITPAGFNVLHPHQSELFIISRSRNQFKRLQS